MNDDFLTPKDGWNRLSWRSRLSVFLQAVVCVALVILAIAAMSIRDIH